MFIKYLPTILQNFFGTFVCTIFFITCILLNKHFNKNIRIYFVYIAGAVIFLAISDMFQGYYETLSYRTWQRMFFASLSYSLRPVILYCFISLYLRNINKITRILLAIPLIINCLIVFTAFFNPYVFYYTVDNQIVRGPLVTSPFLVSIFYFCMIFYFGYRKTKSGDYEEVGFLTAITIFCIIATLLELYGRFQGFICIVGIIGLCFYYLYFLAYNFSFDPLTGAYVRRKLYQNIERTKGYFTIISCDLNGLKKINDTYGHVEGDNALRTCAQCIRDILPVNADLYRMGGDEFIIIYRTLEIEAVENLIDTIHKKINKTKYSIAIGYCVKGITITFDEAMIEADAKMYINKNESKKAK